MVAIVLIMHAVAIRLVNYALYSAAIAAAVLTLLDLPQPANYGAEGDRVLWTLCGGDRCARRCSSPASRRNAPPRCHDQPHNQPRFTHRGVEISHLCAVEW